MFETLELLKLFKDEALYTPSEIAEVTKFHPSTIRKTFVDEPGVIRVGHCGGRRRQQYYTLRIPGSVARRVFQRMTVGA